ncbi:hypothetical protein, partial [uncultured Gimesia sp.]|uniref:hypothetical protein n=1 Tax=uncultured Gimesia sp. TaxID=1678688 RepID=UPI002608B539
TNQVLSAIGTMCVTANARLIPFVSFVPFVVVKILTMTETTIHARIAFTYETTHPIILFRVDYLWKL